MRLIDADKVKEYILTEGFYCDTRADKEYTAERIDELFPTVEAIPISWMNDYMFHISNIYGPMDISTMVRKYKEGFIPSVPEKGPVK